VNGAEPDSTKTGDIAERNAQMAEIRSYAEKISGDVGDIRVAAGERDCGRIPWLTGFIW
jgi:hypothetical protein